VDSVPYEQGQIVESALIGEIMFKKFTSGFSVNLENGGICLMQSQKAVFYIRDVLIGPCDFVSRVGE